MPSLRQLEYLVALSQELHFRRAAEKVNVTQPTLSAQLQELEKRLGASLIERGSGKVLLTPLGREIAERSQKILAQVQDIRDLARSSAHGFRGTVRLGVPPTLGPYLLPHIVPRLHSQHPDLKLYVREGKPRDLLSDLMGGDHDLAVVPLPVTSTDITVRSVFREPLKLVAAPGHPLAVRGNATRSDLAGEKILAMEPGHHLHDQVAHLCEQCGAELLRDYEGTSLDTLRLMVGMGVGLAFLPALYVRSEVGTRGEMEVVDLKGPALSRQIAIVWRATTVHAPLFEAVTELVRNTVRNHLKELILLD
ncbi:hydrogen peroxide-inducible genes activator [Pseudahrensia aquimaris]|uniref:Hydrogen peroxide-inducible genes activator n=1 Tax=Pseudahrensia aquimaris TaxID=744461 RepID=A0ABW3FIM5_9HYPH